LLFASGVEWRRLEVAGIDDLVGAGVYYGAGPSEALACTDSQVVVVGGGNPAGQAVVRFSRYAEKVTLLVRAASLAESMSQYLIDRLGHMPKRGGPAAVAGGWFRCQRPAPRCHR
jgi:thioredoxin reductase (NADPH)